MKVVLDPKANYVVKNGKRTAVIVPIEEYEELLQDLCEEIAPIAGAMPIVYIREGRRRDELVALINEEPTISILVLAAGTGAEGPGPLISSLTGKAAARLRIPIAIVPGGLTMEQVDALS